MLFKVYKVHEDKAFSQEMRLLVCSLRVTRVTRGKGLSQDCYRDKEGLQSKLLTASLFINEKKFEKTYEKTVHCAWKTSKEPSERKGEIERDEGQRTGKHTYAEENRPG
eukprot:1148543-Pelagomonas_calceolata.AAC.1